MKNDVCDLSAGVCHFFWFKMIVPTLYREMEAQMGSFELFWQNLGYSWLELFPLTGRKHQLRVHCTEVLGTPIVGDYKYGWQAHRNLKHICSSALIGDHNEELPEEKLDPFGLNLGNGGIFDKQPRLHLHCKEMILPNISLALQHAKSVTDFDLANVKSIKFLAPLPSHMQKSWDALDSPNL